MSITFVIGMTIGYYINMSILFYIFLCAV